jgi:hypothetical protein
MIEPTVFERMFTAGVQSGEYPPKLYKYRKFDKNTESIFMNHSLWFSAAKDFNDPFDCQIQDPGGYTTDDVTKYLMTRAGLEATDAENIVNAQLNSPCFFPKLLEHVKDMVLGSKGILSLSETPDNILMWSHYCDSHSGFVLGFKLLKDVQFFNVPLRVAYSADYPVFRYLSEPDKIAPVGLGTKSEHWQSEKEIRILKNNQGLHPFTKDCLAEVILGCRIDQANETLIRGYLASYGYDHAIIKKAQVSRSKYELELI